MEFECQKATRKEQLGVIQPNCYNKQGNILVKSEKPNFLKHKLNAKSGISSSDSKDLVLVSLITDLPRALISEILNCLEPKDLGVVSCVNTCLFKLASEHKVWKEFYFERWGSPVALAPLGDSEEKSWKELFAEREFRSRMFMGRYSVDAMYGHTEAVRTVVVLASKKMVFSSGYDQIMRMWDMEEGLSIASSRPLGCTIRAVAADTRLLIAGGTDGFIQGWRAEEGNPHLFNITAPQSHGTEFRIWEHEGPITCLALDFTRIYSGSWDMTIRIWDRASLKCSQVLMHNDWVWSLTPHDTTVASTAGSDVYVWHNSSGAQLAMINNVHVGNSCSLARSHTGKLLFAGGEDGTIRMFEIIGNGEHGFRKIASWAPHTGAVYSLAFEFPWLVSASSDGKLSLIDVRKLFKTKRSKFRDLNQKDVEPPQRMIHGFGSNLFSVNIGLDRIICGGEDGVVRIWNFSKALEIEQRVRTSRGLRSENRTRRCRLQLDMTGKGGQSDQCSVAAKKNQINGDRNSWHDKRRVSGKLKA